MEILIAFLKSITFLALCLGIGLLYDWGKSKNPKLTFVISTIIILILLTIGFYI